MTKFHINKHGVPAPCNAKQGKCPLGNNAEHYGTKEEAQKAVDKIHETKHDLLPEVTSERMERRARAEFRVPQKTWSKYKGNIVEVDYDIDKTFAGEVIDTHYNSEEDSGLIIRSEDGVVKHIKNHRMDDLNVISEDNKLYNYNKNVSGQIEEFKNSIKYHDKPGDLIIPLENDMDDDAEQYFNEVIKEYESGNEMDENISDKYEYMDYKEQIQDQSEEYEKEINEYERAFTEESEKEFYNDEHNADLQTKVFHKQRNLISNFAKEAEALSAKSSNDVEKQRENTIKLLKEIKEKGQYKLNK